MSLAPAIITRLGVIGDVHAEDIRLELALNHLQANGVDQIICTGDVVDGIGCPERSLQLLQAHGVFGEVDLHKARPLFAFESASVDEGHGLKMNHSSKM